MRLKMFVAGVGALLMLAGLVLGLFIPATVPGFTASGGQATVHCGTVWGGRTNTDDNEISASSIYASFGASPRTNDDYGADCDASLASRAVWVWLSLGVGLLLLAGGLVVKGPKRAEPLATTP